VDFVAMSLTAKAIQQKPNSTLFMWKDWAYQEHQAITTIGFKAGGMSTKIAIHPLFLAIGRYML